MSAKQQKKGSTKTKTKTVSRARASSPARAAHQPPAPAPSAKVASNSNKVRERLQSPMLLKHVAPAQPLPSTPARSMPTSREVRKPAPAPRQALPPQEFGEAGMVLAITYAIREGRRREFFELLRELKPLLLTIGGGDCTVYEDRSRPNYFMEVFRFKDEAEFTAFDDKFHKDRKIAAIYALLDDFVEAEKSDFKIFERRL